MNSIINNFQEEQSQEYVDALLFFHHVNCTEKPKKLAVMIKNKDNIRPVQITLLQRGISEPNEYWLDAGKEAQKAYFTEKSAPLDYSLGLGRSIELLAGQGQERGIQCQCAYPAYG